MSLKYFLKRKALSKDVAPEFTLAGDPQIYSTRWDMAVKQRCVSYLKDTRYSSMLKCVFPSYIGGHNNRNKQAVVLLVRFYVRAPDKVQISPSKLKAESVPASESFELCEYLLSLMEKLRGVLINSYRQIVKIDCEKFYSAEPRTVMQFMSWEKYVELASKDTVHADTKSERQDVERPSVQPAIERDAAVEKLYGKSV